MVKELDDLIDEAYQNGVRSGALAQEKKNREELTKTIKFLHDEVYEQGKREGAEEERRKKPRYKTQFHDVPFVPSCDCASWDDCRSEAYKEGYADAIEELKPFIHKNVKGNIFIFIEDYNVDKLSYAKQLKEQK